MKKLLILTLVLAFVLQPFLATAKTLFSGGGQQVVYRGTATGLRISAVDGTAFVDNLPSAVTDSYVNGNYLLEVYDASGRMLKGVLKAVGTGETLDTEVATGTLTINKMYKITATEINHFGTGLEVNGYFRSAGSETCDANNKVKQVLTPSTAGSTIVSTKGGTTYNWAHKNASFTYNAASYTIVVKKIKGESVVASGSITAGNALMDLTTANAFAAPVGVDLTPYQTGDYKIRFFNSTGTYMAEAWISATAPAGESLTELLVDTGFDDASKWTLPAGWSITGSKLIASNPAAYENAIQAVPNPSGAVLSKMTLVCDSFTSGTYRNRFHSQNGMAQTSAGTVVSYITGMADQVSVGVMPNANTVASFTSISCMHVTTPAATGALLLSTKGGSRGFVYKSASLTGNEALTYQVILP